MGNYRRYGHSPCFTLVIRLGVPIGECTYYVSRGVRIMVGVKQMMMFYTFFGFLWWVLTFHMSFVC